MAERVFEEVIAENFPDEPDQAKTLARELLASIRSSKRISGIAVVEYNHPSIDSRLAVYLEVPTKKPFEKIDLGKPFRKIFSALGPQKPLEIGTIRFSGHANLAEAALADVKDNVILANMDAIEKGRIRMEDLNPTIRFLYEETLANNTTPTPPMSCPNQ